MKIKQKRNGKVTLSDKIADALTVKPSADIEDDHVFGTKPHTISKDDIGSSVSEDEAAISDFRKRNIHLLSEVSNKYEGKVVSRKDLDERNLGGYEEDSESEGLHLSEMGLSLENDDSDSEDSDKKSKNTNKSLQGKHLKTTRTLVESSSESDISEESNYEKQTKHKPKAKIEQNPISNSEGFSSECDETDDYSIMQNIKKQIGGSSDEGEEDVNESDEEESGEEDGEGVDISQIEEPMKEEFEHVKKQNVSEEAKKGACVRNQLLIWEGLLEMRIHLQRCMNTANQMPLPDTHEELRKHGGFSDQCNTTKANIATVLDKFLTLQNILLKKYPETKTLSTKKEENDFKHGDSKKEEEDDEEIPSDTDNEEIPSDTEEEDNSIKEKPPKQTINSSKKRKLEDYEKDILTSHKAFKPFRDSTINKWNEKTRIATASVIKNKNLPTNTVLQQIQYILSDRDKLIRRTQLKRAEYDIIGYKKPVIAEDIEENETEAPKTKDRKDDDEYIPEIFDDSDFYHQLLRELIECKSADISDPVQLSRQWIALQQMRSKMKRKVDTKATKGRKIKYVVHNKLVNYMAPEKCNTWTDESTNELYSSLFGKMYENNSIGLNSNLENGFKLKH